KICGITNHADALTSAELGADAIGLNFYPRSRRFVAPDTAAGIVRVLPPFVEPVALFVNEPLAIAVAAARELGPVRTVQWHGERPEVCCDPGVCFIPAFHVQSEKDLARVEKYLNLCRGLNRLPAAVLLDAHVAGQYGGTGQTAPWALLADFRPGVPV